MPDIEELAIDELMPFSDIALNELLTEAFRTPFSEKVAERPRKNTKSIIALVFKKLPKPGNLSLFTLIPDPPARAEMRTEIVLDGKCNAVNGFLRSILVRFIFSKNF